MCRPPGWGIGGLESGGSHHRQGCVALRAGRWRAPGWEVACAGLRGGLRRAGRWLAPGWEVACAGLRGALGCAGNRQRAVDRVQVLAGAGHARMSADGLVAGHGLENARGTVL